jgi:hypothetical protein
MRHGALCSEREDTVEPTRLQPLPQAELQEESDGVLRVHLKTCEHPLCA